MQEPTDRLITQSTTEDEAQTDQPVAIPPGATGELAGNAEAQSAATDNTDTSSTPPVENRSSKEEGSNSESAAFIKPRWT